MHQKKSKKKKKKERRRRNDDASRNDASCMHVGIKRAREIQKKTRSRHMHFAIRLTCKSGRDFQSLLPPQARAVGVEFS
jgi:hypothetical protein